MRRAVLSAAALSLCLAATAGAAPIPQAPRSFDAFTKPRRSDGGDPCRP